jgi:hypothetical protein
MSSTTSRVVELAEVAAGWSPCSEGVEARLIARESPSSAANASANSPTR